jgi:hypothetical protein
VTNSASTLPPTPPFFGEARLTSQPFANCQKAKCQQAKCQLFDILEAASNLRLSCVSSVFVSFFLVKAQLTIFVLNILKVSNLSYNMYVGIELRTPLLAGIQDFKLYMILP